MPKLLRASFLSTLYGTDTSAILILVFDESTFLEFSFTVFLTEGLAIGSLPFLSISCQF